MGEASFRQQSGLFAVGIVGACGLVTPDQLRGLAASASRLDISAFKLSTRQTLIAVLPEDKLGALKEAVEALGLRVGSFGSVVRNVKACAGTPGFCPRMLSDALTLGVELQNRFMDQEVPKDFKVAVSGCHRGCTDPLCADFGAMGNPARTKGGFDVFIGGRGGSRKPRHGQQIMTSVPPHEVGVALEYVLNRFRELAEPHERLCHVIDRVGLASFTPPAPGMTSVEDPDVRLPVDGDFLSFAGAK